jgi:PAS domain S-box-containing protein
MREKEERLKNVLEVDAVGVMIWDLTTGCLVDANNTFLKMMGYSRADIEARNLTWQKFTPPEYHEMSLLEINKFQETGRVGPYEKEYFHKDGKRQWLLFSGSSLGNNQCVEFCIDISGRKKAEEEVALVHQRIQDIIDNTPALVYALDLNERFILVNRALTSLLNTTKEGMIGKRRHHFMPKKDADWHEANDIQSIEAGRSLEFEEYSQLGDRSITWLTTKFPLRDIDGKIYAVAGISSDISERKRLESELIKHNETLEDNIRKRTKDLLQLNDALLKSNKELESFAYVTSHDLQEPLRMVTSYTQLLAQRYGDHLDENAKEYISFAVDGAKRMYDLINDLLQYSRISRKGTTVTTVDLNKIIDTVKANMAQVIKERNVTIQTGNLPVISADYSQMVQLFQNLISNGIKFSKDQPRISISSKTEKAQYVFSVRDNGIGIDSQYFEQIFEIFKRLNPRDQFEGTGIGLAICKRIVENHKGKIRVESELNRGSAFIFTLPKTPH